MSKHVGSIEVDCDAPPYCIVQACHGVGIKSAEDVRWLRMSTFRCRQPDRARGVMTYVRELFQGPRQHQTTCTCGRALPKLELVVVTFEGDEEAIYFIGQCACCNTVFWEAL